MMFRSNACILRIKVTKRWQYIRYTMKGCRNSFFNSLKNIIFILSVETMVYIQRSWRLTRCSVFLCCLFGSLLRSSNNLFKSSESSRNNKVKKFKVWVPQSVRILIGIVVGRPLNVVITVRNFFDYVTRCRLQCTLKSFFTGRHIYVLTTPTSASSPG